MPAVDLLDQDSADHIDQTFRAALSKASQGMSPIDLGLAYLDWISHLAISPGKRLLLAQSFVSKLKGLGAYSVASLLNKEARGPASKLERRVSGEAWQKWPFNVFAQAHQISKDWWNEAALDVDGVRTHHEVQVQAVAEQVLDMLSPANYIPTNPEVLQATREQKGKNLIRGIRNLIKDRVRDAANTGVEENDAFKVGENVGVTPGKVIYQNDMMELIQYEPATKTVAAEPVLLCMPWIGKYYILDLSPKNSMVRWLTEQGKTVFLTSWKNPNVEDRNTSFDDYLDHGLMKALDVVSAVCPNRKINSVGYCLGGSLLCIAAAAMARDGDDRLKSISLFASQADFSEAGEITRFISPSQLSFLEKLMWKQGFLGSESMGGAFSALRASDLVYAATVDRYLMGNEARPNDLMAWNADGTRMPYRMHHEYLTRLYMENQLACNKYLVDGKPVCMADIKVPVFALGTETDHVAPWHSVYKIHDQTRTDVTFVLTSGGHNAGVVSGPDHPRRRYRSYTSQAGDNYIDPDTWFASNEPDKGSWWPEWNRWLDSHSSEQVKPPTIGAARKGYKVVREAPGEYVYG